MLAIIGLEYLQVIIFLNKEKKIDGLKEKVTDENKKFRLLTELEF